MNPSPVASARVSFRTFSDIGIEPGQNQLTSLKSIKMSKKLVLVTALETDPNLSETELLGMAME